MGTFLTKIQAHLIHLLRFPPDHHSVCIRYRHVESRVDGPTVPAVPFASGSTASVRRGASAKHSTPCSEILCNSRVPIGSKASITNLSYGYCKLHDEAKIECPYKDCIWAETALHEAPTMTDDEVDAAARTYDEMWDQANAAAVKSAEAGAEAEKEAAETAEDDVDMGAGDDTDPQLAQVLT